MTRAFSFVHNLADFNVPTRAAFDRTAEDPLRQADVRRNFQHGVHAPLPSNVQFHVGLLDDHGDDTYTFDDMFKHAYQFQARQLTGRGHDLFNGSRYRNQPEDRTWFGSMRVEQMSALNVPLPPESEIFWRNVRNELWRKGTMEEMKDALERMQQGMLKTYAFLDLCVYQMHNLSDVPADMFNIPPRTPVDWKPYRAVGGIKELLAQPAPINTNTFLSSPFLQFSITPAPPGAVAIATTTSTVAATTVAPPPGILAPTPIVAATPAFLAPVEQAPALASVEPALGAAIATLPPFHLASVLHASPSPIVYEAAAVDYHARTSAANNDEVDVVSKAPLTEEEHRAEVRNGKRKALDESEFPTYVHKRRRALTFEDASGAVEPYSPLLPFMPVDPMPFDNARTPRADDRAGGFLTHDVSSSIARWRKGELHIYSDDYATLTCEPTDCVGGDSTPVAKAREVVRINTWKPVQDEGVRAVGKAMPFFLSSVSTKTKDPRVRPALTSNQVMGRKNIQPTQPRPSERAEAIASQTTGQAPMQGARPSGETETVIARTVPGPSKTRLPPLASILKNTPVSKLNALAPPFVPKAPSVAKLSLPTIATLPVAPILPTPHTVMAFAANVQGNVPDAASSHESMPGLLTVSSSEDELDSSEAEDLSAEDKRLIYERFRMEALRRDTGDSDEEMESNAFEYRYVPPHNSIASTAVSSEPCAYHRDPTGASACDKPLPDIEDVVPQPHASTSGQHAAAKRSPKRTFDGKVKGPLSAFEREQGRARLLPRQVQGIPYVPFNDDQHASSSNNSRSRKGRRFERKGTPYPIPTQLNNNEPGSSNEGGPSTT
ncbi:hypothetical protein SCHPADRAFT_897340 [Schizopora paradoxa]|uniref:Uncharacterized protein n=1 Tax=Schizopora paradoxa TaxID=27342 RepID=A0A0H2R3K1_9AGAM|nr:hypothetical protein SCHPADRAFT_897340 [Schizopora paradoxa]